ncbi:hypothetical protein IVA88_29765 [Bradyrhizobium sp. 149]|uniref:hypothetical protein n=1 Tax=Bradyrhizobium sp. 149 TaxID=2782624 RepID=UPI001FF71485|nr:hypothetical protein [Bradyrhizobium sp. 149]MCK1655584.1 hypothetical protein [Bradyrhizobium sp. 149]
MSVDTGHRYQFCKVLKTHFKDTQFVITTHDRIWAEQMKSAGRGSGRSPAAPPRTCLQANAASSVEQWAINKAVHYNGWENLGKRDFAPVANAFRERLECFRCERCESWLLVTPRRKPMSLRCGCNTVSLNLESKQN